MKQVIIGDVHGRTVWKDILNKESDFDRVTFIGDYVDTHENYTGEQQLNNLLDIIQFKKDCKKEVILLIGNHDHHYWPGVGYTGTSGYQRRMNVSFEQVFEENQKLFDICFVDEYKTVYSHAGFSNHFMRSIGAIGTDKFAVVKETFLHRPKAFCFYEGDFSGYGDHKMQSCIWIRPQSLHSDQIENLQVVGHTQVGQINHPAKSERRGFYLIDALASRQYLVCDDGNFTIEQLPK